MKALTLIGSAAAILLAKEHFERERIARFEYPILIVLSTIGMMIMASANDLIGLYLGLELQSLAAYVIASFHRDDVRSTEAGLKYFVLGALSSGMLLYGASLVYGFTGSVSFPHIVTALREGSGGGHQHRGGEQHRGANARGRLRHGSVVPGGLEYSLATGVLYSRDLDCLYSRRTAPQRCAGRKQTRLVFICYKMKSRQVDEAVDGTRLSPAP